MKTQLTMELLLFFKNKSQRTVLSIEILEQHYYD